MYLNVANHRTFPRFRIRLPVRIQLAGDEVRPAVAVDVSPGGLYVASGFTPRPGQLVTLYFAGDELDGIESRALVRWRKVVPANLRRSTRAGFGLEFCGPPPPEWYSYCLACAPDSTGE